MIPAQEIHHNLKPTVAHLRKTITDLIISYDVWTQKTKLIENKCPVSVDDIEEAYLKVDKAKLDTWRKSLESLKK